jgi:hypothetical protein
MIDRDLDSVIERAVRDMTSVDAPADMRARVLARLETAHIGFPWFRLATGVVLATVVIVTLVLVRSRDGGIAPAPAVRDAVQSAPDVTRPTAASVVRQPSTTVPPREEPGPRRVAAAVADESAEERLGYIDPLAVIDPIAVPAIEPESFAPLRISIVPLAPITEIQVEPLSPSGGWD